MKTALDKIHLIGTIGLIVFGLYSITVMAIFFPMGMFETANILLSAGALVFTVLYLIFVYIEDKVIQKMKKTGSTINIL